MAMRKVIVAVAIVGGALVLAACTSQPTSKTNQKTAQNQKTRKVCVSGTPMGTHIAQTNCVTMTSAQYKNYKKAKQKRAEQDQNALTNKFQNHVRPATGPGAGGSE